MEVKKLMPKFSLTTSIEKRKIHKYRIFYETSNWIDDHIEDAGIIRNVSSSTLPRFDNKILKFLLSWGSYYSYN